MWICAPDGCFQVASAFAPLLTPAPEAPVTPRSVGALTLNMGNPHPQVAVDDERLVVGLDRSVKVRVGREPAL